MRKSMGPAIEQLKRDLVRAIRKEVSAGARRARMTIAAALVAEQPVPRRSACNCDFCGGLLSKRDCADMRGAMMNPVSRQRLIGGLADAFAKDDFMSGVPAAIDKAHGRRRSRP